MSNDEAAKYHLLLEENRNKFNKIDQSFSETKSRTMAFLTVDVAVSTFLLSDVVSFFPHETYGIILFVIATGALILSIGLLLARYYTIRDWPSPIGPAETEKIMNAEYEKEVLQIAIDDYRASYDQANKIIKKFATMADVALLLFTIGSIILFVMKFF